ncbi:hypothetical protein ES706_02475 [subsurface metagenome]
MLEWLLGLITGVVAIIIGFALTMVWDNYKFKRESKKKEEIVLSAVKEELVSNLTKLQENRQLIEQELDLIGEEQRVLSPLNLLESGFWDLVKINLPQKLTEGDVLLKIRKVALITDRTNEQIRSRENYRIHNQAMRGYISTLRQYDRMILSSITKLEESLKELQSML